MESDWATGKMSVVDGSYVSLWKNFHKQRNQPLVTTRFPAVHLH